jgi:aspartyl-tRNA(Asn)/glutamyl-tRNA(Gln) amidotransferase subunit C
MPITSEAIEHIAHLARLGVEHTPEAVSIQEDLNRIVAMVDQITSANTQGIEPMAHPYSASQRLRPDIITESSQRDILLALSSKAEAGLFLVPQVIE